MQRMRSPVGGGGLHQDVINAHWHRHRYCTSIHNNFKMHGVRWLARGLFKPCRQAGKRNGVK
jgi:hypothetical protein